MPHKTHINKGMKGIGLALAKKAHERNIARFGLNPDSHMDSFVYQILGESPHRLEPNLREEIFKELTNRNPSSTEFELANYSRLAKEFVSILSREEYERFSKLINYTENNRKDS
ncbi:hypothetical protein COU54_03235 [Candidatus Pacearchaeota archaeon CG10_big_fil_rev_8_21_14_0_10_31_24]|nr:MAG: hypothetical protein COU54_03235 [Candidatus Pacearchaeota archaeon CG10_big_fil_rev_8_21_14_0_10_31_24]